MAITNYLDVQNNLNIIREAKENSSKQLSNKINNEIKKAEEKGMSTNEISDGFHSFGELYKHRMILYIALCKEIKDKFYIWKSKKHEDGSEYSGWFILGINKEEGKQITYHISNDYWNLCDFAETLGKAPKFDGHLPNDVLKRIEKLIINEK